MTIMPLEAFGGPERGKGYVAAGTSLRVGIRKSHDDDHFNHATFLHFHLERRPLILPQHARIDIIIIWKISYL